MSTSGRITFFTSKHGINSFFVMDGWSSFTALVSSLRPIEQLYNDTKRPLRLQFEVRLSTSSTEFSQNLTSDSLLICVFCTGCEPEIVLPTLKIKQKPFYFLDLDRTWTYNLLSHFCLIEETMDSFSCTHLNLCWHEFKITLTKNYLGTFWAIYLMVPRF